MLANTKRLKTKINELRLPWWFNLVKSGIPYILATITSITVMLTLGGWLGMPESVPLLQWVEALFMAMQPAVKFLAVNLLGLGAFLSTLALTSVFIRGFLFGVIEKAALEGVEVGEQLLEQTKELQQNILMQTSLNEQYKNQAEFLKGYAKALNLTKGNSQDNELTLDKKMDEEQEELSLSEEIQQDQEQPDELQNSDQQYSEESEEENQSQSSEVENPKDPVASKQPEPVLFSRSLGKPSKKKSSHNSHKHHHHRRSLSGVVYSKKNRY